MVTQFFAALGRDPDTVHGRAIWPRSHPNRRPTVKFLWTGAEAQRLADDGYNIYAVVNPGGQTDAAITAGVALFMEYDTGPREWQERVWYDHGLPEPTFQVWTGGKSIHHYWVLSAPVDVPTWVRLQSGLLAVCAGSDQTLKNPSRVLRVPGFPHQGSGGMCTFLGGAA